MNWPTPQDYNEAVQNPHLCFTDKELSQGEVETNSLGLPKAMTGAFASVYKIYKGDTAWAVRCFLTNRPLQKRRYELLSEFISFDKLNCTVPFYYIDDGIKVQGQWYPILKMQWIDGPTFGQFIDENYSDSQKIKSLRQQFNEMVNEIEKAGVAHGDLQHGNIIVTDNGLRLVDYDALFVPALKGEVSFEFGHPNFQHPDRKPEHFDPSVDNFSTWLIDASLLAIMVDPRLYKLLDGGDDNIIFKQRDLASPDTSDAFHLLLDHPVSEVRYFTSLLVRMLWASPESIPPLNCSQAELDLLPTIEPTTITAKKTEDATLLTTEGLDSSSLTGKTSVQKASGLTTTALPGSGLAGTRFNIILEQNRATSGKVSELSLSLRSKTLMFMRHLENDVKSGADRGWRSINPSGWLTGRLTTGDRAVSTGEYKQASQAYLDAYHALRLVIDVRDQQIGFFDSLISWL
ncbi:MAG: hypothetical protein K2Z81_21840, partial [Cyanobacteria bacterium]|nr:hypothetical protein [Cyanobacteriota bacterium]